VQSPWWWVSPYSPCPYAPIRPSWSPSAQRHAAPHQSAAGRVIEKKLPLACKLVQARVSTFSGAHPRSPPTLAVPPGARHPDVWRPVGFGARGGALARQKFRQCQG
jgi:hypothetical protein